MEGASGSQQSTADKHKERLEKLKNLHLKRTAGMLASHFLSESKILKTLDEMILQHSITYKSKLNPFHFIFQLATKTTQR